jgi:hypothetical protein
MSILLALSYWAKSVGDFKLISLPSLKRQQELTGLHEVLEVAREKNKFKGGLTDMRQMNSRRFAATSPG